MTSQPPNAAVAELIRFARQRMSRTQFRVLVAAILARRSRRVLLPNSDRAWTLGAKALSSVPPNEINRYLDELRQRVTARKPLIRADVYVKFKKRLDEHVARKAPPPRDRLWRWRWKGGPGTRNPRQFG